MDRYLVLVFVLLVFALLCGGLTLLRREPLSYRQAGEVLLAGAIILGIARLVHVAPVPVVFFLVLYLVTMRVRLLVDLANRLALRGHAASFCLYDVGLRLALNPLERSIVHANRGAALLHAGRVGEAIALLESVLASPSGLGIRLEAASRCNLGLAYVRQGEIDRGRGQLQEVVDLLPGSVYARRALLALQQTRGQS